jgi:hypothetical protein
MVAEPGMGGQQGGAGGFDAARVGPVCGQDLGSTIRSAAIAAGLVGFGASGPDTDEAAAGVTPGPEPPVTASVRALERASGQFGSGGGQVEEQQHGEAPEHPRRS